MAVASEAAPLVAFCAEAANLSVGLAIVSEAEFDRPTRCTPWTVRALLAHVGMGADRVISMLAEPTPRAADTDAAGYYRPDKRFSSETNQHRAYPSIRPRFRVLVALVPEYLRLDGLVRPGRLVEPGSGPVLGCRPGRFRRPYG